MKRIWSQYWAHTVDINGKVSIIMIVYNKFRLTIDSTKCCRVAGNEAAHFQINRDRFHGCFALWIYNRAWADEAKRISKFTQRNPHIFQGS